ncbi:acylphosphatase [Pseudorhizobium tarimense]|uniref:acylphosphatase n=1 Tax=Pseudorhizobium tarimense TaxID=1079109 RepID=A0ABV2H0B3_9HYPH|nr:acylphosphatase [Pseudorhizobium tarimense]MCJ8517327.1 acylphosphatase [Pseudorhizobium tarimense]
MAIGEKALRARITGKVQGVNFRAWTRDEALRLGLRGKVSNSPDGSVDALIAGPEAAVSQMVELFWEGPPAASVAGVETMDVSEPDLSDGFRIER